MYGQGYSHIFSDFFFPEFVTITASLLVKMDTHFRYLPTEVRIPALLGTNGQFYLVLVPIMPAANVLRCRASVGLNHAGKVSRARPNPARRSQPWQRKQLQESRCDIEGTCKEPDYFDKRSINHAARGVGCIERERGRVGTGKGTQ